MIHQLSQTFSAILISLITLVLQCFYYYMILKLSLKLINVTGFRKTNQIFTLGLFHFIGLTNGYTVHYAYTVLLSGLIDWSAFLDRVLPTL